MKKIRISPGITSFWLMNPGILLFYDRILISSQDYNSIYENKKISSFHMYAYEVFNSIIKKYPNTFIVENIPQDVKKYDEDALRLIQHMFNNNKISRDFSPHNIINITLKKYKKWINFNENKCLILNPHEEYRIALQEEHIEKWKKYLAEIKKIRRYINKNDFYDRFKDNPSAIGSFTRLISRSLQLIDLSKQGFPVYDCMMDDYIDGINITEKALSIFMNIPYKGDIKTTFSTKTPDKEQNKYITITNIKEFIKNIEKCSSIRNLLNEIDLIIHNIDRDDLRDASQINKELVNILSEIKTKKFDYAIWIAFMLPLLKEIPIPPHMTDGIKNMAINFYLYKKKYGELFVPYVKMYGTMLKMLDADIETQTEFDHQKLNRQYDFYGNILKNRM